VAKKIVESMPKDAGTPIWLDGGSSKYQKLPRDEARKVLKGDLFGDYATALTDQKLDEILEMDKEPKIRTVGDYNLMYIQAKYTYYLGYYYACCCLIGIIAEMITNFLIKEIKTEPDSRTLREILERTHETKQINLLAESGLISDEERHALHRIKEKRNDYVHGQKRFDMAAKEAKNMLTDLVLLLSNKKVALDMPDSQRAWIIAHWKMMQAQEHSK